LTGSTDGVVMRFDARGNVVWGLNFVDLPYTASLAISGSKSGLYVAGYSTSSPTLTGGRGFAMKLGYCYPNRRKR